ncbi:MAG TPA: hypothetical protein VF043_01725 [Ktedonobacteraceae bacterium]
MTKLIILDRPGSVKFGHELLHDQGQPYGKIAVSTHALLSSSQAEACRLIFPRQEPGQGLKHNPHSRFLARLVE